jgi:hypothetical protein
MVAAACRWLAGSSAGRTALRDVAAFMQEVGLQDWDETDVVRSALVEWRGDGPGPCNP